MGEREGEGGRALRAGESIGLSKAKMCTKIGMEAAYVHAPLTYASTGAGSKVKLHVAQPIG